MQDNWTAGVEAPLIPYRVQSQMRTWRRHRSGQVQAHNQTLAGGAREAHGCSLQQVPIRISLHCVIHSFSECDQDSASHFLSLLLRVSPAGTPISLTVITRDL